jgi:hypothetical protein
MSGQSRNPVWKRFTEATQLTKYRAEFDEINRQQMDIRKQIESLSNNIATEVDGKKVKVEALNQVVDGFLKNIQINSSFTEVQENKLAQKLKRQIRSYNNAKPSDKKTIEKEIKEAILMPLLMSNLKKNGENNRATQLYALAMHYAAGASRDNNTILQTNMLNEGVSYLTTQNKVYQEIAKSIRRGDGDFDLVFTQSGLSFKRKNNRNSAMALRMARGNLQSTKSDSMTREGEQRRFLGGDAPRRDDSLIWSTLNKLHEALGVIKEKVRVINVD